jgi:hypothetical protein
MNIYTEWHFWLIPIPGLVELVPPLLHGRPLSIHLSVHDSFKQGSVCYCVVSMETKYKANLI